LLSFQYVCIKLNKELSLWFVRTPVISFSSREGSQNCSHVPSQLWKEDESIEAEGIERGIDGLVRPETVYGP